jgi:hypothetical protein
MPAHDPHDLHDTSKATAFAKEADPAADRAGRGAGQPAQSPQTDRLPTEDPQTGKNESIKQSLALPHDRDESTDMTGGQANPRHDPEIEQAARDLAAGLKDTSRAPEMDRSYKKMSGKPDE